MKAAIIAIGDELTSGQRIDTNSAWLSQRLAELGISVALHLTAADEVKACRDAFSFAANQAEFIISTGGLGPTADDLTRDALAAATDRALLLNEAVVAHIRQLFAARGRSMADQNQRQAMFPAGSLVVPNPHGTAPGIDLTTDVAPGRQVRFVSLPGVPVEMREMWDATIAPQLTRVFGGARTIAHHRIKCFGVGESQLESMLPDLIERGREPQVGITVHRATITLRITAHGASRAACRTAMQPTLQLIHDRLGKLVFGEEGDELQDVVVRGLASRGQTIATVETSTLGLLAHWLATADAAGESEVFLGGCVCGGVASAAWLANLASVDLASDEFVRQAATLVRQQCRSTYGLAMGAFSNAPKYTIGLASENHVELFRRGFAGHPDIVTERSVKQALDIVRHDLMNE